MFLKVRKSEASGSTFTVTSSYIFPGTEILTVQAADNDDPKTDNVRIFYRLVGQIPESPRALFRVDRDSGVISVQADSMEGTAPQYTLTITAEDAKGEQEELLSFKSDVILTHIYIAKNWLGHSSQKET